MAIRLLVDSAADFSMEEVQALNIVHIPLTVAFGDTVYQDGVNLNAHEFYEKLIESDVLPKTSQPSIGMLMEKMEEVINNGDTVLMITVAGNLSGTYANACSAASEFPGKAFVIDSEQVAIGERILCERALQMIEEGYYAEEIVEILNKEKKQIRLLAVLDTLEYLVKGGRMSKAAAMAGTLLGIKPVVAVEEGKVVVIGKARGSKSGNNFLRKRVEECGGIDFSRPFATAYSGLSDAMLQKYLKDSADLYTEATSEVRQFIVGTVIGTHAGPGAVAVAFFENN